MRDKNNIAVVRRGKEDMSKDKAKLRRQRHKKIGSGKGKKVGFFESMGLKITGYCDGRRGFPRQTDDKGWYSPFMNRDVNSYEEFCSHTWGSLQVENEGEYARLEELIDRICRTKGLLEVARANLAAAEKRESDSEFTRKAGEDKLTDTQIRARRKAENEKKLAPLVSKVAGLEQEQRAAEEMLSDLHSKLIEDDNTTRLICHRVRDHIRMRVDVYWSSALRHHPDGAAMPVMPMLELRDEAEDAYLRQHMELMKRAAAVRDAIPNETAEKEVA